MTIRRKIYYWLPVVIWLVVIFSFSNRPTMTASEFDWLDFVIKKTAHFVEYFILEFLLLRALLRTTHLTFSQILFISILASVSYAASDEWHQSFIPGREPRVRDVCIDTLGILTAAYTQIRLRLV